MKAQAQVVVQPLIFIKNNPLALGLLGPNTHLQRRNGDVVSEIFGKNIIDVTRSARCGRFIKDLLKILFSGSW